MLIGMHREPPKGNQEMGPGRPGAVGRGEQGQAAADRKCGSRQKDGVCALRAAGGAGVQTRKPRGQ